MIGRHSVRTFVAVFAIVAWTLLPIPGLGAAAASPGPELVIAAETQPSPPAGSPRASTEPATGFATPEEAARAYLAGVAANDFGQVMAACAIDEMAAGYHFDLAAVRLNAIVFSSMWAPASNPYHVAINAGLQLGTISRALMFLSYSLLTSVKLDEVNVITPVDEARAQQFMSEVNPAQLADLSVIDIRFPRASMEHSSRNLAVMESVAKAYGADEWTERLALVSHGGTDYEVGFQLIRYGAAWFVAFPSSPLAELPSTGIAMPTTQAEFDSNTSS